MSEFTVREELGRFTGELNDCLEYEAHKSEHVHVPGGITLWGLRNLSRLFTEMALMLDAEIERVVEERQTKAAGIASDPRRDVSEKRGSRSA